MKIHTKSVWTINDSVNFYINTAEEALEIYRWSL